MVDPEGSPGQDDDEDAGQVGLDDVEADLSVDQDSGTEARVGPWGQGTVTFVQRQGQGGGGGGGVVKSRGRS